MMSLSFAFPGYTMVENLPTKLNDFESGRLNFQNERLTIQVVKSLSKPNLAWLIKSVIRNDEPLWTFDKYKMAGFARLADTDVGPAIVFVVGKGEEAKVTRMILFLELLGRSVSLETRATAKLQAAKFLNVSVELHETERRVLLRQNELRATKDSSAKAERHQTKQSAKEERLSALLARPIIMAYTRDGRERSGVPVVALEWQSLPSETKVILVDSIDGEQVGEPIEAFIVSKTPGGNPKKLQVAPVSAGKPTAAATRETAIPQPIGELRVERHGQTYEVKLYRSMADIRTARQAGLNGGTKVAVKPAAPGKIEVFSVHHDRVDTLGLCAPIDL